MRSSRSIFVFALAVAVTAAFAPAALVVSNDADDSAYNGGFSNGITAGSGCGAWSITTGANSSAFTGNSRANGFSGGRGINTPGGDSGRALGLSASDGDVARATLPLSADVQAGQTIRFGFDYGFAETGGIAAAALQNAGGEDLLSVSYTGGGNLDVNDLAGATNTGLGFSSDGFFVEITLNSATTYTATITKYNDGTHSTVSGSLLSPAGGQGVGALSFSLNNIAPSGSSSDQGWYYYFNMISVDDNTDLPTVIASDDAADVAYSGGLSSGLNGGSGFGPWVIATGSNSSAFTGDSRGNGFTNGQGINTDALAWGLAATDGDVAVADRPFSAPLAVGNTISFGFDYGFAETGGIVGAALQNAGGEDLLSVTLTGGGNFDVNDNAGATDTGLGFSSDGFFVEITLDTATTFSGTVTRYNDGSQAAVSGTLLSPAGGQSASQISFYANNIGLAGFPSDPGWFYYFNSLRITAAGTGVQDWRLY